MNSRVRLSILWAGVMACLVPLSLVGCGGGSTNIVFDIRVIEPLPDGRSVIEVKALTKELPPGSGPFRSYILLVRKNGQGFYTRMFDAQEASNGVKLDLAMPHVFQDGDKLSVAVENVIGPEPDNTLRLSNIVEVPIPPKGAANFAFPNPNVKQ